MGNFLLTLFESQVSDLIVINHSQIQGIKGHSFGQRACKFTQILTGLVAIWGSAGGLGAAMVPYYIGVDGQTTIPSGTYGGLPNPNGGRLTLLYNHGDHYHSKGVFRYTGPNLGAGTATEVNPSNYLPEGANPPIELIEGLGIYEGKLASRYQSGDEFSDLRFELTSSLAGFGPSAPETILFNSSGGRWNGSLDGAHIHLELVSLTPGLNIGSAMSLSIGLSQPGDDLHLDFPFAPVFWLTEGNPGGNFAAVFRLVDEEGMFGDSGHFEFRFTAVPEPGTWALLVTALGLVGVMARRKRA